MTNVLVANRHMVIDPTTFYSINTANATVTPLVTTNPAEGPTRAMAVENSTTVLSVTDTPSFQTLLSTNLETGATSALGTLRPSSSVFAALAFGPDGRLYGIDVSGDVDTINPTNGVLTFVGNLEAAPAAGIIIDVVGLTISSVPEPSSWVSAAIGILVLAVYACARRFRAAWV